MTNKLDYEKLQYIVDCLPMEELLCQLAEESSELAQAALKLRRCYDTINPTPTPKEDALKNLFEEIADVWLVLKVLGLDEQIDKYQETMARKTDRWAKRLDWGSE